jgi:hypothetical protein
VSRENGWRVTFDRGTAFIEGPKTEARRRIAACGDHGPAWVSRRNAWATSPDIANRVIDQLDGRQPVVLEDVAQVELDLTATGLANIRPQESLW